MSWKELFKLKAQKLTEKVNELLEHGLVLANDESPMHKASLTLFKQISTLLSQYTHVFSEEERLPLENFQIAFKILLDHDSDSPYSKYPEHQCDLGEQVISLLNQYRKDMEKQPDFWQGLQPIIHAYIGKVSEIINTLENDYAAIDSSKLKIQELRLMLQNQDVMHI